MSSASLLFLTSAGIIIVAGIKLSESVDVIAEKTGLGRAWAGAILLPLATSLPEITTSVSAIRIGAPDLAVGNVFGSNIFNVFIIAIMDVATWSSGPVLLRVEEGHIVTAAFGIILAAVAALSIMIKPGVMLFGVGVDAIVLLVIYLYAVVLLYRFERKTSKPTKGEDELLYPHSRLWKAIMVFLLAGAAIIFAGSRLALAGDLLAQETGLGGTFVGSVLVAISTSLPEVVSSLAAVRMKAYDLAVGNIFGANIFNMLIIFIGDLSSPGLPVLSVVSNNHVFTALLGIVITSIAVISLVYRSKRRLLGIGFDALIIAITYFSAVYLLLRLGIAGG